MLRASQVRTHKKCIHTHQIATNQHIAKLIANQLKLLQAGAKAGVTLPGLLWLVRHFMGHTGRKVRVVFNTNQSGLDV